jgi:integrase/recombinase XerD
MLYTFARAGAVTQLEVQDYVHVGKRSFLKLKEKGGKVYSVPIHHTLQEYLDAYITLAGIENQKKTPLFRSIIPNKELTPRGIHTNDIQRMVKRRAIDAGLSSIFNSHSWRGTGITNYLENGGQLEKAQFIAGHLDSRTTKLYDRRRDDISLDEIERISLS